MGFYGFQEGIGLIHKQMTALLAKRGVTAIEASGGAFDPEVQQAITCCFAMDYLEGQDHTIDRPAESAVLFCLRPEAMRLAAMKLPIATRFVSRASTGAV